MYIVALIRILVTEIFPGNILNVKHGCHRAGNVQGKKFLQGQGKVREFQFKSGEVLWTYNHHIVHEIEQQADSGFAKKLILFARYYLLRSYTVSIYVHGRCLAENVN